MNVALIFMLGFNGPPVASCLEGINISCSVKFHDLCCPVWAVVLFWVLFMGDTFANPGVAERGAKQSKHPIAIEALANSKHMG